MQWWNLAPRAGAGVGCVGRRPHWPCGASYGLAYDFPAGETWWNAAGGPPYSNRLSLTNPPGGFDDPYATVGGSPFPLVTNRDMQFLPFGLFGAVDPDNNSPRVQQWNLTRRASARDGLGGVGELSGQPLGSLPGKRRAESGSLPGTRARARCQRRLLSGLHRPRESEQPARAVAGRIRRRGSTSRTLELLDDVTTMDYQGLKLSFQRRAVNGVRLNGNWTWGRCLGGTSPVEVVEMVIRAAAAPTTIPPTSTTTAAIATGTRRTWPTSPSGTCRRS